MHTRVGSKPQTREQDDTSWDAGLKESNWSTGGTVFPIPTAIKYILKVRLFFGFGFHHYSSWWLLIYFTQIIMKHNNVGHEKETMAQVLCLRYYSYNLVIHINSCSHHFQSSKLSIQCLMLPYQQGWNTLDLKWNQWKCKTMKISAISKSLKNHCNNSRDDGLLVWCPSQTPRVVMCNH